MRVKVFIAFAAVTVLSAALRFLMTVIGVPIGNWYWVAFLCSLPGALCVWILLRERSDPDTWLVTAGFVFLQVVLLGAPVCSRDNFLADFQRVHAGMTESQVELALGKYMRGSRYVKTLSLRELAAETAPASAGPPLCESYRHSTDGLWNADVGTVCYQEGKVVSTEFDPD